RAAKRIQLTLRHALAFLAFVAPSLVSLESRRDIQRSRDRIIWQIRIIEKGRINENTDINSNIGVTAHGTRPDGAATDDARADERDAGHSADKREEDASRAGAGQTRGKN